MRPICAGGPGVTRAGGEGGGKRGGGERREVGGGRGGGDNINYLVKIITENKVFNFILCDIGYFCLPLMYVRYRF